MTDFDEPTTEVRDEQTDAAETTGASQNGDESATSAGDDLEERLVAEGEIAGDYLEELLDILDFDGDIDLDVEGDRAVVSIDGGDDLAKLVGRKGEVLDALQELTRLAVYRETGERSRLMLDVSNYRANRKAELEEVGRKAVEEVKATGTPVRLDPMTPFERKVVHDVVAAAGLTSESEGEEPRRRVVVQPS
jgi:spoIIIJ-associated protein